MHFDAVPSLFPDGRCTVMFVFMYAAFALLHFCLPAYQLRLARNSGFSAKHLTHLRALVQARFACGSIIDSCGGVGERATLHKARNRIWRAENGTHPSRSLAGTMKARRCAVLTWPEGRKEHHPKSHRQRIAKSNAKEARMSFW